MAQTDWKQVKEIFVDAAGREPELREEFLEKACGGDAEVRREVESLLASYNDANSFMETPAAVEFAEEAGANNSQLERGQTLGHYKIIEQIGTGGMGEVYLAQDTKLDRKVAIKVLYEKFGQDESNLQRFIQEAKAASGLNHPNILVIHEIGETEKAHYIVSEHIEGKTLRDFIKDSSLELTGVLDYSTQIVGALSAAHEAHLVHRDIKPENIMVRPDGFLKILDFGLAKLVESKNKSLVDLEDETVRQNQTAKGVVLGTVNYMSPEQAKGKKVDERTDIFSFGVVLYEMITGSQPFASESTNETIAAILKSEPAKMSSYTSNIPAELERIVTKCLKKNPEKRYQHTKDLLIDIQELKQELDFEAKLESSVIPNLERFDSTENKTLAYENRDSVGQGANTTQQNVSSAEYITEGIKEHKFVSIAALAVLVLSLSGFGYYVYFAPDPPIKSIAVIPFENESAFGNIDYLSDGMTESLINSLSRLSTVSVKARSSVFRYKGREIKPGKIGEELNVGAVLLGRLVRNGEEDISLSLELVDTRTETIIWTETYERKMKHLAVLQSHIASAVSEKLQLKLSGRDRKDLTKRSTQSGSAYRAYLRGRFHFNKQTKVGIEKAIENFKDAIEIDPEYALAWSGLATAYIRFPLAEGPRAQDVRDKARNAALKAVELDPSLAEAQSSLANFNWRFDWKFREGERGARRAIELNPRSAFIRHEFAWLLAILKENDEAVNQMNIALELDPLALNINRDLGMLLAWAGRLDESIAHYKKLLELEPNFRAVYYDLGYVYELKKMYPEAVENYLKHMEINGLRSADFIKSAREKFLKGGWKAFDLHFPISNHRRVSVRRTKDNPVAIAEVLAQRGDKDNALRFLKKAYEERNALVAFVGALPLLKPLRNDPRFKELKRKIGLPE